jgi:uncharacterized protein YdcH (DUF465 family)
MPINDPGLKQELLETNEDFRRLYEEHQDYEKRLESIYQKALMSQEDEAEQKRIKLHKLSLKDQMEQIMRASRGSGVSA